LGKLEPAGECGNPEISPDGRFVAYDCAVGPNRDVWTAEIATGQIRRLTSDPDVDHGPVWSPDSSQILFDAHRTGGGDLYVMAAAGGTQSRRLPWPETLSADDWSQDGRFIILTSFTSSTPHQTSDIWVLPATPDGKPFPWLKTRASEFNGRLSPDGHWLAYVSDESGRNEIYVQSFNGSSSAGTDRWQVSIQGGMQPRWRRDGRELFYLGADSALMSVEVMAEKSFTYKESKVLFTVPELIRRGPRNDYDVTPDGTRFLVRTSGQPDLPEPIHVIVNWPAKLAANSR
jgi:Tol biopolymer transport system component